MSTDIAINRLLFEVAVQPEFEGKPDVVQRVRWALSFERNGFKVLSYFETFLSLGTLDPFTPIEQLTKEQVLSWAYAQENGDAFVAQNLPFQDIQLKCLELNSQVVVYPNFPVDGNPALSSIPTEIL